MMSRKLRKVFELSEVLYLSRQDGEKKMTCYCLQRNAVYVHVPQKEQKRQNVGKSLRTVVEPLKENKAAITQGG